MPIVGLQRGKDAELAKLAIRYYEEDIVIERFPSGSGNYSDTDGRYYKPESQEIAVKACVQPISALPDRDLRQLSEAERIEAQIVVWSETKLFTSDSKGADAHEGVSDNIIHQGERFKIIRLQRRHEGAYFDRAICGLHEDQSGELHSSSGQVQ